MTELGMMLLRRVRIAFRVGLPALQRRLPDPWDVHPDTRDVSQGANLAVLFYEIFLNQAAQGLQLTTADALGRYFVLGIPSRQRRTEETAFMVFRIFTAHPTGANPFGWKGLIRWSAADKFATSFSLLNVPLWIPRLLFRMKDTCTPIRVAAYGPAS